VVDFLVKMGDHRIMITTTPSQEDYQHIKEKLIDFISYDQVFFGEGKKHWIAFCYHLEYVSGELKNLEPEKHDEVKWFSLDKLPGNISPYTKKVNEVFLSTRNSN